ncbi:hypothetical protein F2Q69_00006113 [Brassica cretica]|uniref:Uncharacterized protein n=1 Tax=Brassica cretica TaxID=69181 RepID=A0A8S9NWJ0_BRACR|nr:hypothetical protein F2Q69_00006113 [Brassica cretica]
MLGRYVATEFRLELGRYQPSGTIGTSGTIARSLRSDRASARVRSLRRNRAGRALGCYVATKLWLELGRYVATELRLELGRYVASEQDEHSVAT